VAASKSPKSRSPRRPTSRADDPATAYAKAVCSGDIIAGPSVRASCKRHLEDLKTGAQRGLHFDVAIADHAIGYFRDVLRLNGGEHEGVPFKLQPWQAFIVGSLWGWRRADGFRRFRTAYIEIGKGNGKSPLAAGIGLLCLTADDEPRAEVYAAATKKDQAMILFRDAVAMVDQSPELNSRLIRSGGQQHCWNLGFPAAGSFFRAISSDDGQSGPRPHCSLIDEVHEHPNATVINMLQAGQKGRRQPLTVEITNSGFDRTSICYQHHEYSARVVQGIDQNDEWFAYVCGLDEGEDPLDPKTGEACWIKANPNLGVSIKLDYLRKQVREARGMPAQASVVRRLNFCQWVDAENPWISGPLWLACEKEFDALEVLREADEVVGALDLSGTGDLSALGLTGKIGNVIVGCVEFWTPRDTMDERAKRDKVPYPTWVDLGHITATPGRAVDYAFVAHRLADLQQILRLKRVCFDPYRIKYLEVELDRAGVEIELIEHPQGYYKAQPKKDAKGNELPALWMPRSVELLEKAIVEARLQVQKNPVLTWNSASAVLEADPKNNRIFTKRKSRGRIDGIVSLCMSHGLLADEAPPAKPKQYQFMVV
jgi:phage terminase large subunit-like protein